MTENPMPDECANLATCDFFKRYGDTNQAACAGFIYLYCRGSKQSLCKRKEYRALHDAPPPTDMLPDGTLGGLMPEAAMDRGSL
jgi:hypothetical protein